MKIISPKDYKHGVPEYEFECKDCGIIFESFSRFETNCPECFSGNIKRNYSLAGVIYKGSGFYKTDNTNKE